jgi:hypothetical protein
VKFGLPCVAAVTGIIAANNIQITRRCVLTPSFILEA